MASLFRAFSGLSNHARCADCRGDGADGGLRCLCDAWRGDQGQAGILYNHRECTVRKPVWPGDLLELHVKKVASKGPLWKFRGVAMVEGKKVAEADFGAMIVDPGN